LYRAARRLRLPGLSGASLYDVGKFFVAEISDVDVLERADIVTFNFILAIPPTFLFLFSLIPYLPIGNLEQTLLHTLKLVTPNTRIYQRVEAVVRDFLHKQRHNVLSFGILLSLWYASNGMAALMKSFDRSLSLYKKRHFLARRWTAIKLTLMLILVLVATLIVLMIQNNLINKLILHLFHNVFALKLVSYLTLAALVFVAISLIYTYGPSLTHSFRFVSAGSVFATLVTMAGTSLFFFLVNNFLNYNKVYGSIGALIAFMAWLWYNTIVLLVGYELNMALLLGKLSREDIGDQTI
jgi:membrane protein